MSEDLQQELADIFSQACKVMKDKLKKPEEVTAADLNAVLGFLKHNGITALPVKGSPLKDLADQASDTFEFPFAVNGKILAKDDPAVRKTEGGS